jgi:hypothetical protein
MNIYVIKLKVSKLIFKNEQMSEPSYKIMIKKTNKNNNLILLYG